MKYIPTIGLEIHTELKTKSKMFCSCKNDPLEKKPNSNICPVCTAQPGSMPVANKEAIKKTIKTGLALNCSIPEKSKFDRKNYFYPDLPKGYQISQYDMPFCSKGYLEVNGKKIRITRVHLEEDTGRLIHDKDGSLVDFNRAGIPLMELVTEPDISSSKEARVFAEELHLILRYLGVSDADMEKGQMRVEVNISLSKDSNLGTKVEVKNLNSFKSVEKSIDYEIKRQSEVLEAGDKVVQETRGWDEKKDITVSQRKKEEAHDYRYFPEPDLPTIRLDKDFIQSARLGMPELPSQRKTRLIYEYAVSKDVAELFVNNKDLGEYFEKVMSELRNWVKEVDLKEKISKEEFLKITNLAVNYITTDFWSLFSKASIVELEKKVNPENFAELITIIYKDLISSKTAKEVLKEMFKTGVDPSHVIKDKGLIQMSDSGEIESVVKDIIAKNAKAAEDYKKGKANALQFLAGQVMAVTKGRAKPDMVQELLKKLLK